ncbi:imidazole glycerol phosphate synthase subunit HisH [Pseudochryseolinea flava]|uniref:Imidazole glycerol phosphate synthase subunit HisH n=1 Tax=Pseudochryseolinea flava TaxID=2059302 RepID=A0A364Y0W7_9BACT|nr:imidazole glycerol phosphate synthase subunit HisH [Pseudochryseolinea flava]RAV99746.1 imidazole glycerol phosphate synthase subunit HisH [Pseudochryseolinea flava]
MIAIVDYQAGNIGSIQNMLKKLDAESTITSDPDVVRKASKIILPGVGAFDFGVSKLKSSGITEVLHERKTAGTPVLGICLGAQLMCLDSQEGVLPGLGWVQANVIKFPFHVGERKFPVPHIGWDRVSPAKTSCLFDNMPDDARFYFVHSFYIKCRRESDRLVTNTYGISFDSAFEVENVVGVQFHPEKSHKFGFTLLKNFVDNF